METLIAGLLIIVVPYVHASCETSADCSLAGECASGTCRCDTAFMGDTCAVLNLVPASGSSRALYASNRSTWGGSVISVNGTYYMYTAQMINGCGLNSWECNSVCSVATSTTIEGPYKLQKQIVGAFCHNPTAHIAPDGTFLDVPVKDICKKPPQQVHSTKTLPDGAFLSGQWRSGALNPGDAVDPPNIAYSTASPLGPFTPLGDPTRNNAWAMNNPAVLFFPNGSLLVIAKFSCNSTVSPIPTTFCRQFGVYFGESWRGPYAFKRMIEVFGEDPYLFRSEHGIHMIADLRHYVPGTPTFAPGLNAVHHAFSPNGYDWTIANSTSAVAGEGGVIPCRTYQSTR